MREILFRGKHNSVWIEGYFGIKRNGKTKIYCIMKETVNFNYDETYFTDYEVTPESVGQYTGLTDKNGKKIFEGDIVNIEYLETTVKHTVIEYIGASFYGSTHADTWELNGFYQLEVIGNIHDNPELLKGEEE